MRMRRATASGERITPPPLSSAASCGTPLVPQQRGAQPPQAGRITAGLQALEASAAADARLREADDTVS
jgi:hypothetical protein